MFSSNANGVGANTVEPLSVTHAVGVAAIPHAAGVET